LTEACEPAQPRLAQKEIWVGNHFGNLLQSHTQDNRCGPDSSHLT
jgi:hypothetical protein